jgi:sec-independent protein translocase protein TatA
VILFTGIIFSNKKVVINQQKSMNVFGIGLPEMILILVVALLVFGPKKLPEIGRSLGKAIRGFQDASKEFENEFKKETQQLEESVAMKAELEEATNKKEAEKVQNESESSS